MGRIATVKHDRRGEWSHLCLLCHFQGIIDFDSQVPDSAFKLCMTKQESDRFQVLRPAINQRSHGSPQRVSTIHGSRPMVVTHTLTIRAYCLVDKCSEACKRLGSKKSSLRRRAWRIHASRTVRACSVSNCTGWRVFLLHHDGP